jgi:hypothetical protein
VAREPLDKRRELVEIASEPELKRAAVEHSAAFIAALLPLSLVAVLPRFYSLSAVSPLF